MVSIQAWKENQVMRRIYVTLPLEASQRTENCLEFLRILWNPLVKASVFHNGSDFMVFREVGFAGKLRESCFWAKRASFLLQQIGTDWERLSPENAVVEAIGRPRRLRVTRRRACLVVREAAKELGNEWRTLRGNWEKGTNKRSEWAWSVRGGSKRFCIVEAHRETSRDCLGTPDAQCAALTRFTHVARFG